MRGRSLGRFGSINNSWGPSGQAPRNRVLARANINVLDAVDARIIEGVGERVKALIKDEIRARNQTSKRRCNRLLLPNTVPEAC